MKKAFDLVGMKFGLLTVASRNYERQEKDRFRKVYWNCICRCGNSHVATSGNLRNGIVTSCGCYKRDVALHKQRNAKTIGWEKLDDLTVVGVTNAGDRFYIDSDDLSKVCDYCWHRSPNGYIVANARNGSNGTMFLHRVIMDAKCGYYVDHINRDKSDNRKSNLRIATKSQNNINIKVRSNNTSGYPGVCRTRSGKYNARISRDGKRYCLGTFKEKSDAILARRKAEIHIHGEWSGENVNHQIEKLLIATDESGANYEA